MGAARIDDGPEIDPAYFAGDNGRLDLEIFKECVWFARKIVATKPLADVVGAAVAPTSEAMDKEEKLEKYIVNNVTTEWHPIGTCAMGGRAGIEGGVVDERLRVYGVGRLRVVDASVMPLQLGANPQWTVYAVAEKAADMILEDMRGDKAASVE